MAITFEKVPDIIELSRNNFHVWAKTDLYAITPGARCRVIINGMQDAVDGSNFTITWPLATDGGPSINFVTTPSASNEVAVKIAEQTVIEWLDTALLPVLRIHTRLAPFEINRVDDLLEIKAKEIGSGYDITTSMGWGATEILHESGIDEELRDMKMRMRVHVIDKSGTLISSPWEIRDLERFVSDEPAVYGIVRADLNNILNGMLPDFFPDETIDTPTGLLNNRAFVEVAEHYVTDIQPNPYLRSGFKTELRSVLKGATRLQDMNYSIYSKFYTFNRFITNLPNTRYVYRDLPDYLWYFHKVGDGSPAVVLVNIFYTDGSNSEIALSSYTDEEKMVRIIPCGFDLTGLGEVEPSLIPYKYVVRVVQNEFEIAQPITFMILDNDDTRGCIQYLNSYGLLEALHLEGNHIYVTDHKRKTMDIVRPEVMGRETMLEFSYDRTTQTEVTVQSVPMRAAAWQGYQDLLYSKTLMYRRRGSFRRIAVQLVPGTVQFIPVSRGSDIGNMQFKLIMNKETGNSVFNRWMS